MYPNDIENKSRYSLFAEEFNRRGYFKLLKTLPFKYLLTLGKKEELLKS